MLPPFIAPSMIGCRKFAITTIAAAARPMNRNAATPARRLEARPVVDSLVARPLQQLVDELRDGQVGAQADGVQGDAGGLDPGHGRFLQVRQFDLGLLQPVLGMAAFSSGLALPFFFLALFPQYRTVQKLAGADRVHPADLWLNDWAWRDLPPEQRQEAIGKLMKDVAKQVEQLEAAGRADEARRLKELERENLELKKLRLEDGSGLTADWRVTPHGVLSLGAQINRYKIYIGTLSWALNAGTVATPSASLFSMRHWAWSSMAATVRRLASSGSLAMMPSKALNASSACFHCF